MYPTRHTFFSLHLFHYIFSNTSSGTLVPRNEFKTLYGLSSLSTAFFITSYALNASIIGESEQPLHCIATYSATLFKCSCSIFQYYTNNSIPKVYYLYVAGSGFAPQTQAYSIIPALPLLYYPFNLIKSSFQTANGHLSSSSQYKSRLNTINFIALSMTCPCKKSAILLL